MDDKKEPTQISRQKATSNSSRVLPIDTPAPPSSLTCKAYRNNAMLESSPYPGVMPSLPPPKQGETISLTIEGEPPYKDLHFSIRNPTHPKYGTFSKLREVATDAMKGRRWYDGPVRIDLALYAPNLEKSLIEYAGGVMDTLDGSHGFTYTYLPIAYQDDCQVVIGNMK